MGKADFDHIAGQYDRDFSDTLIGKAQRKLVWKVLDRYYPSFSGLKVLEVNCGTGVDAALIAQKGGEIFATDISKEMVEITRAKLESYPNAKTEQLDLKEVNTLKEPYDLLFSNFGGLNCLEPSELASFIQKASSIITQNGKMVLVIMPKNTIWETLYFSYKLSPLQASRRMKKGGALANVEGANVRTYYYNPSFFRQFEEWKVESVSPIGLFIPPSYLEKRFIHKPQKIESYYHKDATRFNKKSLAKFADHYCIVLKKK